LASRSGNETQWQLTDLIVAAPADVFGLVQSAERERDGDHDADRQGLDAAAAAVDRILSAAGIGYVQLIVQGEADVSYTVPVPPSVPVPGKKKGGLSTSGAVAIGICVPVAVIVVVVVAAVFVFARRRKSSYDTVQHPGAPLVSGST